MEKFLEGEVFFRSLSYFRDYEDQNVKGDQNEGVSAYWPTNGLVINNETQGTSFFLGGWGFESTIKQDEIFVFCASRSLSREIANRFQATYCIEISDVGLFCRRVEAALHPREAKFPTRAGSRSARIGWPVKYYNETDAVSPRWALPGVIATSKLGKYSWQNEFRLVFSLTDALDFEEITARLVCSNSTRD